MFVTANGADLHPAALTREFEWMAFRAGLPPIRFHDLRHGGASIADKAGGGRSLASPGR